MAEERRRIPKRKPQLAPAQLEISRINDQVRKAQQEAAEEKRAIEDIERERKRVERRARFIQEQKAEQRKERLKRQKERDELIAAAERESARKRLRAAEYRRLKAEAEALIPTSPNLPELQRRLREIAQEEEEEARIAREEVLRAGLLSQVRTRGECVCKCATPEAHRAMMAKMNAGGGFYGGR